jgi:hypothetical protein
LVFLRFYPIFGGVFFLSAWEEGFFVATFLFFYGVTYFCFTFSSIFFGLGPLRSLHSLLSLLFFLKTLVYLSKIVY